MKKKKLKELIEGLEKEITELKQQKEGYKKLSNRYFDKLMTEINGREWDKLGIKSDLKECFDGIIPITKAVKEPLNCGNCGNRRLLVNQDPLLIHCVRHKEELDKNSFCVNHLPRPEGMNANYKFPNIEKQPIELTESEKELIKTIRSNLGSSFDNYIEKSISNGIRISINLWITQK